jgi:hypothetical protein
MWSFFRFLDLESAPPPKEKKNSRAFKNYMGQQLTTTRLYFKKINELVIF